MCVVQGILDLEYMLDNLKNLYIIAFYYLPEYFPHTAIWNLAFWFFQQTHRQTDIPTALSQLIYYLSFIIYFCISRMSQIKLNPNIFSYSIYPVSEISVFHQLLLRLLSFYDQCYNMKVLFKWCSSWLLLHILTLLLRLVFNKSRCCRLHYGRLCY